MSLVTISQARALINTSLSDPNLQDVIDRVEAEIAARIGAPQDADNSVTITETLPGEGENLFVKNEVGSVVNILEDGVTLSSADWRVWGGGVIERLPAGSRWGNVNVVTFKPVDDRARRAGVIIDLVRMDLNRTAMESESVAGEYSYTAIRNFEAERKRIIRRLAFPVTG